MNRVPGPSDNWYSQHNIECGGSFIKISEPPKKIIKKNKESENNKQQKSI